MDANDFARRCLRRVTGQLSLEDQWIPPLPDFLVELCEEVGIDPMPGALMAYFREAFGVMVAQTNKTSTICDVTIPDQPDADALMSLFASVPLTLVPPWIWIRDADVLSKTASPYDPDGQPRQVVIAVKHMVNADGHSCYPYLQHLIEAWNEFVPEGDIDPLTRANSESERK